MTNFDRRQFLLSAGAASLLTGSLAMPNIARAAGGKVVVVGGGPGGATAAKYIRMADPSIEVTLIEPNQDFYTCFMSNEVLSGERKLESLKFGYAGLAKRGVKVVHDLVVGIDGAAKVVTTKGGQKFPYDRCVVSPGIDFAWGAVPGYSAEAAATMPHAWKAGAQTELLRKQLEAMPDGGVFVMVAPPNPYRCPPGPYERACLVADYFKKNKPKSKVVILDANEDVMSKKGLFTKAWTDLYKDIVEYRNNSEVKDVDVASNTAILEFDKFKADVLNVIPPHRAGDIAAKSGLKMINNRWVDINWLSMEVNGTPGVHVIGDAIFPAPTMPKSGHMANQHGKLAAAAILNMLSGQEPSPTPVVMNTCYSFVDAKQAIHVASVHQYDAATKVVQPVKGAGGVSVARSELEGKVALGWAKNIWADMLA